MPALVKAKRRSHRLNSENKKSCVAIISCVVIAAILAGSALIISATSWQIKEYENHARLTKTHLLENWAKSNQDRIYQVETLTDYCTGTMLSPFGKKVGDKGQFKNISECAKESGANEALAETILFFGGFYELPFPARLIRKILPGVL